MTYFRCLNIMLTLSLVLISHQAQAQTGKNASYETVYFNNSTSNPPVSLAIVSTDQTTACSNSNFVGLYAPGISYSPLNGDVAYGATKECSTYTLSGSVSYGSTFTSGLPTGYYGKYFVELTTTNPTNSVSASLSAGTYLCSAALFGNLDPAYGQPKECLWVTLDPPGAQYVSEGQSFTLSAANGVGFLAVNQSLPPASLVAVLNTTANPSTTCDISVFQGLAAPGQSPSPTGDIAYGTVKSCNVYASYSSAVSEGSAASTGLPGGYSGKYGFGINTLNSASGSFALTIHSGTYTCEASEFSNQTPAYGNPLQCTLGNEIYIEPEQFVAD
jgi:hypothetical protein